MSIFYEYLTGEERELAIEEAKFDTQFAKLDMMYEMVNMKLNQMCKDAELKVLTESGTYDDLEYLMTEAENEAGGQKQGILSKIANTIKKFFSTIMNKLKSLIGKGDANETVTVSKETIEKSNAMNDCLNKAQSALTGAPGKVLALLGAIAIPVIVHEKLKSSGVVEVKRGELDKTANKLNSGLAKLQAKFDSVLPSFLKSPDNKSQDESKQSMGIIKKIGDAVNGITASLAKASAGTSTDEEPSEGGNQLGNSREGQLKLDGNNKPGKKVIQLPDTQRGKKAIPMPDPNRTKFYTAKDGNRYRKKPDGTIEMQQKHKKKNGKLKNTYIRVDNPDDELLNAKYEYANDDIMDDDVMTESTKRYIFGYDLSNEDLFTESDNTDVFDKELEDLCNLFGDL